MVKGICVKSEWYAEDVVAMADLNGDEISVEAGEQWLWENETAFLNRMAETGNEILRGMTESVDWSVYQQKTPEAIKVSTRLCECVYDISMAAAGMIATGRIYCEDSRELFYTIQKLAEDFEREWKQLHEDDEDGYIEEILLYAERKLLEQYKYEQRGDEASES